MAKVLVEAMVIEEIVAAIFEVRVTVKPPSMTTTSPFAGTEAPGAPPLKVDHVDVAFQFPEATEYLVTAYPFTPQTIPTTTNNTFSAPLLFLPKNFVNFFIIVIIIFSPTPSGYLCYYFKKCTFLFSHCTK